MNTTTPLSIIANAEARAKIQKAQLVLRGLNHPLRRNILACILDGDNKLTVTEIYVKMRLEQSVASQHLAILRKAGAVTTERDGKHIFYSVSIETIEKIVDLADDIIIATKN